MVLVLQAAPCRDRAFGGAVTSIIRVVLFMDVLRPLPYFVGLLNRVITTAIAASPFTRHAKRNHEVWEPSHGPDMELIQQPDTLNLDAFI
jgi:hypothetical protein